MKYIIYQRASTIDQEIETQQHECLKYISAKCGGVFEYRLFSDPDTSSKLKMTDRPQLMAMLDFIRNGDHIVVYKLDRLSRDVVEMITIWRQLKAKGCTIHSLNDFNADDELTISLMGSIAQYERKAIRTRIKSRLDVKRENGLRTNYAPPYGYRIDSTELVWIKRKNQDPVLKPGKLVIESTEQLALAQMLELFDVGLTYRQIASVLTDRGYKNREGKPFQHSSIYRILARTGRTRSADPLPEAREFSLSLG